MDDALDTLLSVAAEELPCTSKFKKDKGEKFLENISAFVPSLSKKLEENQVTDLMVTKEAIVQESNVHTGETDSSDDEENRYFETCKYDSFGSAIKQMLSASSSTSNDNVKNESTWQTKTKQLSVAPAKPQQKTDVYTDPVFGIRIVNPLISGSLLQERMSGRVAVSLAKLKTHIKNVSKDTDWVIAGAIVHKFTKTSQKGSAYAIWTLSDLHPDLKTVALFLFGNAFKELWKTSTGSVVGILNPFILDKNSNTRDEVCKKFDEIGSNLLSRGFIQLEKRHSTVIKRVKALLPRRESERRAHPLARHCDILSAVETRISMLNMTFMKYIESNLCCFIPGKVIDEIERVLRVVESEGPPPRTHELLQELRDISSMAMEHFDEQILPNLKMQIKKTPIIPLLPSTSKSSKLVLVQYAIVDEVRKVRKQYKAQKMQLNIVTSNFERFLRKIKRQNLRLKAQSIKIKEQERKIQEQSVKIQEQESTIADIKKHMDEWEQKFSDLTSEVRARDDFISSKTPAKQTSTFVTQPSVSKYHLQNIKPRKAQVLSKTFNPIQAELERKRKSNLTLEIPSKLPRCMDVVTQQKASSRKLVENVDELLNSLTSAVIVNKDPCDEKSILNRKNEFCSFISSSLENILKSPISSIKSRKRKMTEDIDLK